MAAGAGGGQRQRRRRRVGCLLEGTATVPAPCTRHVDQRQSTEKAASGAAQRGVTTRADSRMHIPGLWHKLTAEDPL